MALYMEEEFFAKDTKRLTVPRDAAGTLDEDGNRVLVGDVVDVRSGKTGELIARGVLVSLSARTLNLDTGERMQKIGLELSLEEHAKILPAPKSKWAAYREARARYARGHAHLYATGEGKILIAAILLGEADGGENAHPLPS